mgnify:CR=1 FL=1
MSGPIRVLLVEDNPGDADLTRETLEEDKVAVDVTVVGDGALALDYLHRRPPYADAPRPDLVLLDLNLPKVGGAEVIAEAKASPELRAIPFVVLSSSDTESEVARLYALGASCYVTKPVGLAEFQKIVRSIENFWFSVVKFP